MAVDVGDITISGVKSLNPRFKVTYGLIQDLLQTVLVVVVVLNYG